MTFCQLLAKTIFARMVFYWVEKTFFPVENSFIPPTWKNLPTLSLSLVYLCAIFISLAAHIAELAHGERSRTQSLSHSSSLYTQSLTQLI